MCDEVYGDSEVMADVWWGVWWWPASQFEPQCLLNVSSDGREQRLALLSLPKMPLITFKRALLSWSEWPLKGCSPQYYHIGVGISTWNWGLYKYPQPKKIISQALSWPYDPHEVFPGCLLRGPSIKQTFIIFPPHTCLLAPILTMLN